MVKKNVRLFFSTAAIYKANFPHFLSFLYSFCLHLSFVLFLLSFSVGRETKRKQPLFQYSNENHHKLPDSSYSTCFPLYDESSPFASSYLYSLFVSSGNQKKLPSKGYSIYPLTNLYAYEHNKYFEYVV